MGLTVSKVSRKPKKKSAFDAFFEAADQGNQQQAVKAFEVAATKPAVAAFESGGFDDFFTAADAAPASVADAVNERLDQSNRPDQGAPPPPPPANQTYTQGAFTGTADDAAAATAAAEAARVQREAEAAAAANADRQRREQEEATNRGLTDEVMGAIRNDPMGFSGGSNLLNYRTSGGQSLNDLPQGVQDQINAYLGGGEYGNLLNTARDADPGTQLQRVADEQRARDLAAQTEAAAREKREAASAAALAAQQAASTTQASTAAIDQAAPVVTGDANVVAGVGGVAANQNTGLNAAINEQLAGTAGLNLESNDELRRNQQALLAELSNQAEAAGKSAVTDLALPDLTKVNVPAREMSTMEQAIDTRLTDRLTGGQFLDPQSALTNEAEAQALERLQQDNFLGESAGLDSAERRAMDRMTNDNLLGANTGLDAAEAAALKRMKTGGSGVDIEGVRTNADGSISRNLAMSAEDIIRQRLLGGENPMMAAQRARVEKRYGTSMDEGREMLNRLGVLRGGDTADVFNELTAGRDQQMLDVDAMGFDLQSQAIADALGYQGRRDQLGLANEELARAAIGDVAGLAGQRDQRNVAEQSLQRGAISDVSDLAGQRDQRGIAEQGLRRQAISDTLPFQQRRDAIGLAEQDLQRAAISDALGRQGMIDDRDFAEAELTGALRGSATLPARMAQAGLQFDAAGLQQDVADRTLARLLTQTEPTQRERFEEGVRQSRFGEGLATRADLRAEEGLASELFGQVDGRGSAPARQTLTGQTAQQDLLNQELQRRLAQSGDTRAEQALQADLFGEVEGIGSARARTTRGGEMDAFNMAMQRAGLMGTLDGEDTMQQQQLALTEALQRAGLTGTLDGEDTMQRQQLEDALLSAGLDRRFATSADRRAGQALEADLFGEVSGEGSDPTVRSTLAGQQFDATEDRAERALREDVATSRLQRDLAEADVTGIYNRADTRQANLDRFNRQIGEASLTGQFKDQDTLAERGLSSDLLTAESQREAMEDDLISTALDRTLAGRADTRDAMITQSGLATDRTNRRLAGTADDRAERGLSSDLLTAESQREAMTDDLISTALDRTLAGRADTRAAMTTQSGLATDRTNRRLAGTADDRAERGITSDLLTAESQRAAMADDLTTAGLNRQFATSADRRAGQAQDAALFGEVAGEGSDPTVRTTLEGTLARNADERAQATQDRAFENELITQLMTVYNDPNLAVSDPSMRIASILARRSGEAEEKLPQGTLEASDTLRRLGLTDKEVDMVNQGVPLEQIFRIRNEEGE